MARGEPQIGPRRPQDRPKMAPRRPPGRPKMAKMAHYVATWPPRWPQSAQDGPQEASKMAPRLPKMPPRLPKRPPRRLQTAPRRPKSLKTYFRKINEITILVWVLYKGEHILFISSFCFFIFFSSLCTFFKSAKSFRALEFLVACVTSSSASSSFF